MKTKQRAVRRTWSVVWAAFSGVLLMAAGGCCCYVVQPCCGPQAAGRSDKPPKPNVSGGPFVPTQERVLPGGQVTVCSKPVSGKYVRFLDPPTQSPEPGNIGFRASLWDLTADSQILNTDYYLQLYVNSTIKPCCTNVTDANYPPNVHVGQNVTAGYPYRFIVHFKTGAAPPNNHVILLQGEWTTQ